MLIALLLAACGPAPAPVDFALLPPSCPSPHAASAHPAPTATLPRTAVIPQPPPANARSILWISLDTVGARHLAMYGGRAQTPRLAELASQGRLYTHAYTHFVETAISHFTLLTGVLPDLHGNVPGNGGSLYKGPTAAEITKANGYRTAAFIGGITLEKHSSGLDRGFDVYDDDDVVRLDTRPAPQVVGRATSWWADQQGPAFMFVHLFDAHFPYTPADPRRYDPNYTGRYDGTDATLHAHRDAGRALPERDLDHVRALYESEITELDAALVPLLAAAGPDTVVVVAADHGESFEHGYYFNHRASLYDETLHVPLILRAPGLPTGRDDRFTGLVDVLPTVLRLAGLHTDAPLMGRDLADPPSDVLFALTDRCLPPGLFAARTPNAKAIWGPDGAGMAFDLVADPNEQSPGGVPELLRSAPRRYSSIIQALSPYIANAPQHQKRPVDRKTSAQLESLGYVVGRPPPAP